MPLPFNIPKRLNDKLESENNTSFANKVETFIEPYNSILRNNNMYFFPEYTDHGINHIKRVLEIINTLIPEEIYLKLTQEDIGVIILSVVLHDIGMQTSAVMFKNMIDGVYDIVRKPEFRDKKWKELWEDYLKESYYWDKEKKINIFGDENHTIIHPNLNDLQSLDEYDKKFIGEFIRKHHCRLAHDIALKGYIGEISIRYEQNNIHDIFPKYLDLAGLVARSHGTDIRKTYPYIEKTGTSSRRQQYGVHTIYLMALIRIADYLDVDNRRTDATILETKKMYSPFSRIEHEAHLTIINIDYLKNIKSIRINANPTNVREHVKVIRLVEDIQNELDKTLAVLGEIYDNDFFLQYRRVVTNITDEKFENDYGYVPKQFSYKYSIKLSKLLIKPLYGDNPSFGVREIVQNAVDSCRECMNDITNEEKPYVVVKLDTKKNLLTVKDTGKGMTLEEIENYFLTIGSSYNDNINWKQIRDNEGIYRTGRFGIGFLAYFLLGEKITVFTRSRKGESGYRFEISLSDIFIEIKKEDNLDFGTTIEILCDRDGCMRNLLDDLENKKTYYTWYGWFVDQEPIVRYYCDEKKIIIYKKDWKEYRKLTYNSKQFGEIRYKTINIFDDKHNFKPILCCSGFYITSNPNKKKFSLPFVSNYYPFEFPSLQIADNYNILPLNLNRTNIDGDVEYDFELELVEEVCKDLICQLFAVDDWRFFYHSIYRYFYFGWNNFTIINNYTNRLLKGKILFTFDSTCSFSDFFEELMNEWYSCFDKFQECLFTVRDNWNNIDQYGLRSRVFYRHVDFNKNLFNCSLSYKDYLIEKELPEKHKFYLQKFIDLISSNPLRFSVFEISEIREDHNYFINLDFLFNQYLKGNPMIPFNSIERSQKYKTIYNDKTLSKWINDYRIKFEKLMKLKKSKFPNKR